MNIEYINDLTNDQAYHLLTAMRGPDSSEVPSTTKWIITRRLRAIVFTNEECLGEWTDLPLTLEDVEDIRDSLKSFVGQELPRSVAHFLGHLISAVLATVNHPVWGGLSKELLDSFEGALPHCLQRRW